MTTTTQQYKDLHTYRGPVNTTNERGSVKNDLRRPNYPPVKEPRLKRSDFPFESFSAASDQPA